MPIPKKKDAIKRTTAKEKVFKELQSWIINGTLEPDERLNDNDLAEYFSVSRTPVREALQMLSEQKLVYMVPSSGTYVAPIDMEDMKSIYKLLGELQALAAEMGADHISDKTLRELEAINKQFLKFTESGEIDRIISSDHDFHKLIAELPGNPYLTDYTCQLMAHAHRNEVRYFNRGGSRDQSSDIHGQIIRALKEKNTEEAKKLLRDNWQISLIE